MFFGELICQIRETYQRFASLFLAIAGPIDLADGGSAHFAETIMKLKQKYEEALMDNYQKNDLGHSRLTLLHVYYP